MIFELHFVTKGSIAHMKRVQDVLDDKVDSWIVVCIIASIKVKE